VQLRNFSYLLESYNLETCSLKNARFTLPGLNEMNHIKAEPRGR
jgi:hypothetical protein